MNTNTIRNDIISIRDAALADTIEREKFVEVGLTAVLARQHAIAVGVPGVAKSMVIELLANLFGVDYARTLLSRQSKLEDIFGAVSLKALKNDDVYRRNLTGTLADCHIGFIDETDKANNVVINAMLTLLNERLVFNPEPVSVPLISMFGAGNAWPDDDTIAAFYDRFLFRLEVKDLALPGSFVDMMELEIDHREPILDLPRLQAAHAAVDKVHISRDIYETMQGIRSELLSKSIAPSSRRYRQSKPALRAAAWLDGRDEVAQGDLMTLADILWVTPDQQQLVLSTIADASSPAEKEAMELAEQLDLVMGELIQLSETWDETSSSSTSAMVKIWHKVKKAKVEVAKLKAENPRLGSARALTEKMERLDVKLKEMVPAEMAGDV